MNYHNNMRAITSNPKGEKEQQVAGLLVTAFVLRITNQVAQSFSLIDDAVEVTTKERLDKQNIRELALARVKVLREALKGTMQH